VLAVGGLVLPELQHQTIRAATGLAGGVGNTHCEVCGALSGGVLVIGACYGRESICQSDALALSLSRRYRERFAALFDETQCAKLREKVQAPGGMGSCAVLVERAAGILLEVLAEAERSEENTP
jgi:C_GCAxxG_C_C family probable redox protein